MVSPSPRRTQPQPASLSHQVRPLILVPGSSLRPYFSSPSRPLSPLRLITRGESLISSANNALHISSGTLSSASTPQQPPTPFSGSAVGGGEFTSLSLATSPPATRRPEQDLVSGSLSLANSKAGGGGRHISSAPSVAEKCNDVTIEGTTANTPSSSAGDLAGLRQTSLKAKIKQRKQEHLERTATTDDAPTTFHSPSASTFSAATSSETALLAAAGLELEMMAKLGRLLVSLRRKEKANQLLCEMVSLAMDRYCCFKWTCACLCSRAFLLLQWAGTRCGQSHPCAWNCLGALRRHGNEVIRQISPFLQVLQEPP